MESIISLDEVRFKKKQLNIESEYDKDILRSALIDLELQSELSKEEYEKLLYYIIKNKTTCSLRDKLIFELAYSYKLNAKEILNLKYININFELMIITISRKRKVNLKQSTFNDLTEFINNKKVNSDYIFTKNTGKKLEIKDLDSLCKKYLTKINVKKYNTTFNLIEKSAERSEK
jgi:site-specific recombinase XerD